MIVQKRDGSRARKVLTAMITDPIVLGRVSTRWSGKDFASKWENLIGTWCVEHYKKYGDAPREGVEAHFAAWAETVRDKETAQLVEKFLTGLSGEYERESKESNSALIIDTAGELFDQVRIRRATEEATKALEAGRLDQARKAMQYTPVEMGKGAGIDLFNDMEVAKAVFRQERKEPLIEYPGAAGSFFGDRLGRGDFVAVLAPAKRGKTSILVDMAFRAVTQRRKVAFFEVGDESEEQISERFFVRASRKPFRNDEDKWPMEVKMPKSVEPPSEWGEMANVEHNPLTFDAPLTLKEGWAAFQDVVRTRIKSNESYFKLSVHSNMSLSALGLKAIIQHWSMDGWSPDVVIIDYADNLAAPTDFEEGREGINANWKYMRGLALERHCLVVTATQGDSDSYGQYYLTMSNFSDDRRKNDHVTALFGINQTEEEKEMNLLRFNWINTRRGQSNPKKFVHLAACPALCNPCVKSCW